MKVLFAFAFLLLGSSVLADGPLFGIWHVDGHNTVGGIFAPYQWQLDQQNAGYPMETCIRMQSAEENGMSYTKGIYPIMSKFDRKPLVLRMNNITQELPWTIPRVKLTEDNWRTAYLCVYRNSDGSLGDTNQPSPWAGTSAWSECGKLWAISAWMTKLQQVIPNPTGLVLCENNEGAKVKFVDLKTEGWCYWKNATGNLRFIEDGPYNYAHPEIYYDLNGNPLQTWAVLTPKKGQLWFEQWHPDSVLDKIDLRAKEWVAPLRATKPSDASVLFDQLIATQYKALYAAFDAALTLPWQGKLKVCGYNGGPPIHNTASLQTYFTYLPSKTLTDPQLLKDVVLRRSNTNPDPKWWSEISINHSAETIYKGVLDKTSDFVDADSFGAFFGGFYAWALQAPNKEVRIRYWKEYLTRPEAKIANSKTSIDQLVSMGRNDLVEMTIADCEISVMKYEKPIHEDKRLNEYWLNGTTQILSSPLNNETTTRVYATETTIPGVAQTLLCVYSPCTLVEPIQVGKYTLPKGFARFGYYLTNSLEKL